MSEENTLTHQKGNNVNGLLDIIVKRANQSKEYQEMGIDDSLASNIRNMLEAPLSFMKSMDDNVISFSRVMATHLFALHKDKIHSLYRFEGEPLHYGVFLKNNDQEARFTISKVLREYRETWLGQRHTIIVNYIDLKFEDELESGEKIDLSHVQFPPEAS